MLILTDFLNIAQLACGKNGYDYKSVKRWTSHKKLGYELVECDKVM
jgi:sentrin-specific protease 1